MLELNPRWRRPSRQYFGFRSSRAATALHVSKKNITFALIKVSTFICKREISGLSSPLIEIVPLWPGSGVLHFMFSLSFYIRILKARLLFNDCTLFVFYAI